MATKPAVALAAEKIIRPCLVRLKRCDVPPIAGNAKTETAGKSLAEAGDVQTTSKTLQAAEDESLNATETSQVTPQKTTETLQKTTETPQKTTETPQETAGASQAAAAEKLPEAVEIAQSATENSQGPSAETSPTDAQEDTAEKPVAESDKLQNSKTKAKTPPAAATKSIVLKKEATEDEDTGPPILKRQKRECVGKRAASLKKEVVDGVSDKDDEDYGGGSYDATDSDDSDAEWAGGKKKRGGGGRGRGGGTAKRARVSPAKGKPIVTASTILSSGLIAKSAPAPTSSVQGPVGPGGNAPAAPHMVYTPRPRGRPLQIYECHAGNGAANGGAAPTSTPVVRQMSGGRGSGGRGNCMELVSSEMTPELMAAVTLANNMNIRRDLDLQTLYVKIDDASDGMNALLGWAVKDENKLFFQCMFCPTIDTTAKGIAAHIRRAHHSLAFAMVKKVPPAGQLLFMHCRRCDYITVDTTSVWIHFGMHHGLRGILSRANTVDITPPPTVRRPINAADTATVFPFYKCSLCEFLATDNRYTAQHAVQNHKAGDVASDYNGCFVRVVRLSKPKQPVEGESYGEVAARTDGLALAGVQSDTFVCVLCSYVSFCHYLAMSHHMRVHTEKFLMYKCSYDQCKERCATADSMIQHLKGVHECGTVLCQRMCCQVTIVEKQGDALVESFSLP